MHDDEDVEDTVIRPRRGAVPPSGGTDPASGRPLSADRLSDALDDTVIVPRRPGVLDDDPFGDTIVRPSGAVPPEDDGAGDTVVRPRPDGDAPRGTRGVPPVRRSAQADDATRTDAEPVRRVPSIRVGRRVVRLDRPVIVGRRPALPRIVRGPEPELVTVPSPSGQVSSSHVLVHAEGEAVVVDDLGSTNGTVVRPAAGAARRMPSGASIVVLTGTVVEIGDGNAIEILSPYLRTASPSDDLDPVPPWPSDPLHPGTPRTPRERS